MSVSFGRQFLPTKIELIRIRRSLRVSEMVHKILEDKREVLLKRLDEMIIEAAEARQGVDKRLFEFYRVLYDAYLKMGPVRLESTAYTTPPQVEVEVNARKVVDVDVPIVEVHIGEAGLTYGLADTTMSLDQATRLVRQLLPWICRAAGIESSIFRLANELKRTQRLINALEYIIIPQYKEAIKSISSTLEEREREEFVRLKHVKALLEERKALEA